MERVRESARLPAVTRALWLSCSPLAGGAYRAICADWNCGDLYLPAVRNRRFGAFLGNLVPVRNDMNALAGKAWLTLSRDFALTAPAGHDGDDLREPRPRHRSGRPGALRRYRCCRPGRRVAPAAYPREGCRAVPRVRPRCAGRTRRGCRARRTCQCRCRRAGAARRSGTPVRVAPSRHRSCAKRPDHAGSVPWPARWRCSGRVMVLLSALGL
jgi:hypothetical protein